MSHCQYKFLRGASGGLMEIAIYFSEKLILFLFRLHNEE